jgi:hypothetical protein
MELLLAALEPLGFLRDALFLSSLMTGRGMIMCKNLPWLAGCNNEIEIGYLKIKLSGGNRAVQSHIILSIHGNVVMENENALCEKALHYLP